MKSYRKYTTEQRERKVFAVLMAFIVIIIISWGILEACGVFDEPVWKPVGEYPIANAHISWDQTYYPGPMGGADNGH